MHLRRELPEYSCSVKRIRQRLRHQLVDIFRAKARLQNSVVRQFRQCEIKEHSGAI